MGLAWCYFLGLRGGVSWAVCSGCCLGDLSVSAFKAGFRPYCFLVSGVC